MTPKAEALLKSTFAVHPETGLTYQRQVFVSEEELEGLKSAASGSRELESLLKRNIVKTTTGNAVLVAVCEMTENPRETRAANREKEEKVAKAKVEEAEKAREKATAKRKKKQKESDAKSKTFSKKKAEDQKAKKAADKKRAEDLAKKAEEAKNPPADTPQ